MKRLLITLTLALLFQAAGVQADMLPPYFNNPFITIYVDTPAVTTNGTLRILSDIGLNISGYDITGYALSGDSLILTAIPDSVGGPILLKASMYVLPSDTFITFTKSGIYGVFLQEISVIPLANLKFPPIQFLQYAGSVRILPILRITPANPVSSDSFQISVILGKENQCPVMAYTPAIVGSSDSFLTLNYSAIATRMACDPDREPWEYGPVFDLEKLAAATYSLYLPNETDTGHYLAGAMTVSNPLLLNGSVRTIANPLLDCAPINCGTTPISGAAIAAVEAPLCGFWNSGSSYNALLTASDAEGLFQMNLSDNGMDFKVDAQKSGYFPQSIYTSMLPTSKSLPPQKTIEFALIDTALPSISSVNITVTIAGTPVESASVNLSGGRQMVYCLDDIALAKTAAVTGTSYFYGYTKRDGTADFDSASLTPFIDYYYTIYKYVNNASLQQSGYIRLNPYSPASLSIDLSTGVEERLEDPAAMSDGLTINPNPFNPSTTIHFANPGKSASLAIYDIKGTKIAEYKALQGNSLRWDAGNRASGIYVVKLMAGKHQFSKKMLLQK